jgi:hypothetical protein
LLSKDVSREGEGHLDLFICSGVRFSGGNLDASTMKDVMHVLECRIVEFGLKLVVALGRSVLEDLGGSFRCVFRRLGRLTSAGPCDTRQWRAWLALILFLDSSGSLSALRLNDVLDAINLSYG